LGSIADAGGSNDPAMETPTLSNRVASMMTGVSL